MQSGSEVFLRQGGRDPRAPKFPDRSRVRSGNLGARGSRPPCLRKTSEPDCIRRSEGVGWRHNLASYPRIDHATSPGMEGATMRRLRIVTLCVGFIAMTSGPALAQSVGATTGAINGKVTDATGGVMPGVTVTIASASMQGVRTVVTNEEGTYRFPAIPPGEYTITYELAGFSTV